MKLERELHDVAYWFLGVGLFIGVMLAFFVLGVGAWLTVAILAESERAADTFVDNIAVCLPPMGLAALPVATKGRYGKLSVTNVLITFAIGLIPVIAFFAIPYYIGKGFWILVTRQKPTFED